MKFCAPYNVFVLSLPTFSFRSLQASPALHVSPPRTMRVRTIMAKADHGVATLPSKYITQSSSGASTTNPTHHELDSITISGLDTKSVYISVST